MKTRRAIVLTAALALLGTACGAGSATTTQAPPASTTSVASPAPTTVPAPTATPADATGGTGSEAALPSVLTAFSQTTDSGSGRMEGSLTMLGINGFPGSTLGLPFSGSFAANGDYSFALDMSGLAEASGEEIPPEFAFMLDEMEIRQIGDTAYIRYPFFSMMFGLEPDWLAAPADESSQLTDGFGFATPTRPTDILGSFGDADATITDLGRESVNGLEATHYRVLFDTEALYAMANPEERAELEAEGIPDLEFPMEVWITDTGILTRFVMDIDGSAIADTDGEGFERMLVTYDLFDLGTDIEVETPSASEITSADELGDLFNISP